MSASYCFAPMRLTLCTRLDDPSDSLYADILASGATFGSAKLPLRQVPLHWLALEPSQYLRVQLLAASAY